MRFSYTALLTGLLAVGQAHAWPTAPATPPPPPAKAPAKAPGKAKVFLTTQTHPDVDVGLVVRFLESVPAESRPYWVFFAFDEPADEYLAPFTTVWRVVVNTVSSAQGLVRGTEVPGSNGRLYAVDIREPRWTLDAFLAVSRRDERFREPHVSPALAKKLRDLTYLPQDPKTFHVGVVVPALWFTREVLEADRSDAYYDLLYAQERFGDSKTRGPEPKAPQARSWAGDRPWTDGRWYPKGSFTYIPHEDQEAYDRALAAWKAGPVGGTKNFPADTKDFEKKWGAQAAEDFLRKEHLRVANGEVVAGARSDPVRGSYVAYQDRVIFLLQTPLGVYLRTFDSLKTAGKKNYANDPRGVLVGDLEFDAGELLSSLPNGLQAALLVNGQGKRVEIADSRIARNTKDPADVTVRTQVGCITCHAPQGGVISPSNKKITEAISRGNRLLQKDADLKTDLEGFLLGLDTNIPVWRVRYQVALTKLTASPNYPKGWTGAEFATQVLAFRDWYDAPVTLPEAAAELGYPPLAVILACLVEGSVDAGNLLVSQVRPNAGVPRTVWDEDLFKRLALILAAARTGESGEPLLDYWIPGLLEDALRKTPK